MPCALAAVVFGIPKVQSRQQASKRACPEKVGIDLTQYDHVTICSPIWVFALAAPVRSFCQQASGKIKEVDYLLVHHQNSHYENAAQEMDELLGINHTQLRSVRCREGIFRRV
jgi:hypothetical protein